MVGEWRWAASGETDCPCCGARYQVMTARGAGRRFHYARCEICDEVMAEWIDSWERRYLRVGDPKPIAARAAAPLLAAQAG